MAFAEVLFVIGAVAGGILGLMRLENYHSNKSEMHDELKKALAVGKYAALDNWLILYGDRAPKDILEKVTTRRDELYINESEKHLKRTVL